MNRYTVSFGELIRSERKIRKWSLRKAAKEIGITDSYLCQLENGHYINPSASVIINMWKTFQGPSYTDFMDSIRVSFGEEVMR